MSIIYYLIAAAFAAAVFATSFKTKDRFIHSKLSPKKALSLFLAILFIVREFMGDYLIQETIGLNINSPFGSKGNTETLLSVVLIWLIYAAELLIILYPFFEEHLGAVRPVVTLFLPLIFLASFAGMEMIGIAFDGGFSESIALRPTLLALEIGAGLGLSASELALWIKDRTKDKLSFKKLGLGALIFLGMLLISIPCWAPQAILGDGGSSILINDLTTYHRIALYLSVVIALAIYLPLKNRTYEQKRFALIYVTLATMISYSYHYTFANLTDIASWPLHLCNTAMYIIPLVLIFKMEKLYYFTIFINVLGAFFAMIMPNTSSDIAWLSASSVQFWSNHYMAFLMPMLIMALGIFKRPKMKQFTYSLIAFFGYYLLVLFVNAWLTNYDAGVDFFFINSDFIADKLGEWAKDLRTDYVLTVPFKELKLIFYPVYQVLFFTVYIVLSFAMWFLYEQVFEITDTYKIISERNRKIKVDRLALEAHLAGRSMQEPMNPENSGKLILRHFSKRYSTSDVYAVYDANLEIEGGQIFGFLGPNGAGKSTIIKSIVGIQTITSGSIEVSGYDVEKQAVGAKMQIGFVPDHYALYENLTGREYINYIADLYRVDKKDRDERIRSYVERFRLEAAIDNPMKTYSHGMKQKITIMSALVHDPKVWILDEPLTGLDPESIFQVKECMKEHAAKGNIVFFSSHIIDVVERICDRIAIIRKGQILTTKSIKELEEMGVQLEDFYMSTIDGNTQSPVSAKVEAPKAVAIGAEK